MKHYIIAGLAALMTPFLVACSDDDDDRGLWEETPKADVLSLELYDYTCCVIGGEAEVSLNLLSGDGQPIKADKDITVTIDQCDDPNLLVDNYNSDLGCDYAIMPDGACTVTGGIIAKGGNSLTLKVKVDQSKLDAAFKARPFMMPVRITPSDASIECDAVMYVTAPIIRDGDDGSKLIYLTGREPSGEIYFANPANDKSVLFCPGGDFSIIEPSDIEMAKNVFKDKGITLAVSRYRMPNGRWNIPACDTYNIARVIKANKAAWGGAKSGIMGYGAGGHVAATLATYAPKEFDFQVLLSPVITMAAGGQSPNNIRSKLIGSDPTHNIIRSMSIQYHITADVAPSFVAYSLDDSYITACWNAQRYINGMIASGAQVVDNRHPRGGTYWGEWSDYPDAMLNWINNLK